MSTVTETDIVAAGIEDVDPTCEVDETRRDAKNYKCYNPAVWVGVPPCGHEGFFCEQHHCDSRSFKCLVCGNITLLATYRWIRL
jgi:hypothetical protein